ncbi:MAG: hypothetical protein Q9160_002621 [Pyrenula sp. 1 TL-2023]
MAPRLSLRVPTTACLSSSLLVSSPTRTLVKLLSRLSRSALIETALEWLQDKNLPFCEPYLTANRVAHEREEEDYAYAPANSIEELRETYAHLRDKAGSKRDVIDRMLDGDWRRGLSMYQLAIVDVRFLQDHDSALRWTALKLVPIDSATQKHAGSKDTSTRDKSTEVISSLWKTPYPALHAATFLRNLQREVGPVVKAHYHICKATERSLTIIRLYVTDSPYANPSRNVESSLVDSSRTLFLAFPDSCPFVYVSVIGQSGSAKTADNAMTSSAYDAVALKKIVLEAVPKALSRPHYRFGLENTSLTAKSLATLMDLRGPGKRNASNGAYSIFAEGTVDQSPLNACSRIQPCPVQTEPVANTGVSTNQGGRTGSNAIKGVKRKEPLQARDNNLPTAEYDGSKKRKIAAGKRFGAVEPPPPESKGIDRYHVKFTDPLFRSTARGLDQTSTEKDGVGRTGHISVTFHGSDVFGGIRRLVEAGVITKKMPSWMTGESGVSSGTVSKGTLINHKGGGA